MSTYQEVCGLAQVIDIAGVSYELRDQVFRLVRLQPMILEYVIDREIDVVEEAVVGGNVRVVELMLMLDEDHYWASIAFYSC